jgi:hypothetical protein
MLHVSNLLCIEIIIGDNQPKSNREGREIRLIGYTIQLAAPTPMS